MKLNLQREALLKPLQTVIGVVEKKQTMAILSNVLLRTDHKKLFITGTDLEVELIGHTAINEESASTNGLTLPGRKLIDICRALPENAAIELYQEKEKVILRSGRSRFTLATLPAQDFPSVKAEKSHVHFSLNQHEFKQLLQRTAFAMANQDVRYYLNGLLLEALPNHIRAVATDGHRLATNIINVKTDVEHRLQVIIPRKGVMELMRLLEDSDQTVELEVGSSFIRVTSSNLIFTSKLVEGRFPDYERVIPKSGDKIVEIDRDVLKLALQRTAILCNEKFKGVRFELANDQLKISSNNPEQETAEEALEIAYQYESLDIGFNVNYFLDILSTVNPGPLKLIFSNPNSSVLIQETNNKWNSAFVIMPMKL